MYFINIIIRFNSVRNWFINNLPCFVFFDIMYGKKLINDDLNIDCQIAQYIYIFTLLVAKSQSLQNFHNTDINFNIYYYTEKNLLVNFTIFIKKFIIFLVALGHTQNLGFLLF